MKTFRFIYRWQGMQLSAMIQAKTQGEAMGLFFNRFYGTLVSVSQV